MVSGSGLVALHFSHIDTREVGKLVLDHVWQPVVGGADEKWPDGLLALLHDLFAAQLGFDLIKTLHVRVHDIAALATFARWEHVAPERRLKLEEKAKNVHWVHEVDEGEANRTLRLEIHGKVEIVVCAVEFVIYK